MADTSQWLACPDTERDNDSIGAIGATQVQTARKAPNSSIVRSKVVHRVILCLH